MNGTFGVFLVGDGYLPGALALKKSLDSVASTFPLTAFVSDCSPESISVMEAAGISVSRIEKLDPPDVIEDKNRESGFERWNGTFSKLHILGQDQFDKIVLLDADMMVMRNIDDLFKYPHMSAVVAGGVSQGLG